MARVLLVLHAIHATTEVTVRTAGHPSTVAAAGLDESISAVGTHLNGDRVSAPTVHMSKAPFQGYRARADKLRWRPVTDNGNVIADGSQGYASKRTALNGIRSV